jgi:medium-chain acyl-[acyl-carrier-protein] hydrolase
MPEHAPSAGAATAPAKASAEIWFQRFGSARHPRMRLFCFPYAGGFASLFGGWAAGLPADIEVRGVQLPGRPPRMKEAPYTRLAPLIGALAQQITPLTGIPFAFFGHSLGGLVAYTLARELHRRGGACPSRLFISGCPAPHLRRTRNLHGLPEGEFRSQLDRLGGTPKELLRNAELMDVVSPIIRADFEIYETSDCGECEALDTPITAFGATDDEWVSLEEAQGWRLYSSAPFRFHRMQGGHFFIHAQAAGIRRRIAIDLDQNERSAGDFARHSRIEDAL